MSNQSNLIRTVLVVLFWYGAGAPQSSRGDEKRPVEFIRDIAPILEQHCLRCHHADQRKGDVSLATPSDLMNLGYVVPGDADSSYLLDLVTARDGERPQMPQGSPALSPEQVALLRAWISAGAKWPQTAALSPSEPDRRDWWAFQPLQQPPIPTVPTTAAEVRNPVDAFVWAKLADQGLDSSPEAARRTLIRRLYFDLAGLPPTPEQVAAFVADPRPDAYERLVDRLLASPAYGERWARHWLDVVHYGDTHGYDKDKPRPNAWPYRDYVIRALNADKPWSRFVAEQVAGDVLYPGTRDGIEALGFLAAGPWDFVGHAEVPESKIDGRIARHLDRDDMVRNTMQSFNSLTVGCAQCHDHKFDPVAQADYYSLQAVFAAIDRADKPYFSEPDQNRRHYEFTDRRRVLLARQAEIEQNIRRRAGEALAKLETQLKAAQSQPVGSPRPEFGYHSAIDGRQGSTKWVQVDLGRSVSIDRVVLRPCFDNFNGIGAGFGFPVRFRVEASDDPQFTTSVRIVSHEEDVPNPGTALQSLTAGVTARYVRVTATKLAPRRNDFILALAELEVWDGRGENLARGAAVTALDSIEAPPRWRKTNLVDGIAPASDTDTVALQSRVDALRKAHTTDAEYKQLAEIARELQAVEQSLAQFPAPHLVYAGTVHHGSGNFLGRGHVDGKPRPIYLLHRGDVQQPGPELGPGALSIFPQLPSRFDLPPDHTEGDRRAALARWLTARENALTWRSIVNRVWQYHFGRGLVETPNDFGHMGAKPTHPELLDWLAADFRDHGQSLKRLHRLLVTSATYRQASRGGAESQKTEGKKGRGTQSQSQSATHHSRLATYSDPQSLDADNRYLWRMNRRKLEAEAIRDSLLFVSGRLRQTPGGPGFQDFVVEKPEHSPHYQYHLHDPDDPRAHRRAVYRFIARSQLQPFMNTLDCADPSLQVGRRNESLTPLQALTLLNNGLVVTMSRHFATRLEQFADTTERQVARGFSEALGRPPSDAELRTLTAYTDRHGLANYCRLLFNLNEFSFVD